MQIRVFKEGLLQYYVGVADGNLLQYSKGSWGGGGSFNSFQYYIGGGVSREPKFELRDIRMALNGNISCTFHAL